MIRFMQLEKTPHGWKNTTPKKLLIQVGGSDLRQVCLNEVESRFISSRQRRIEIKGNRDNGLIQVEFVLIQG